MCSHRGRESRGTRRAHRAGWIAVGVALAFTAAPLSAQENYEIEVYPSLTTPRDTLMLELHSNFSFDGQTRYIDGVAPSNHADRETLEATLGLTRWAEAAGYVFANFQPLAGAHVAGGSARVRVRIPDAWAWPVGLSLATEVEYARPLYSEDQWSWEIRPIVDTYRGRWYLAVNPTLERVWKGVSVRGGLRLAPSAKVSYDLTRTITAGLEYYSSPGEPSGVVRYIDIDTVVVPNDPSHPNYSLAQAAAGATAPVRATATDTDELLTVPHGRQELVFAAIDLHASVLWEVNLGIGIGTTASTDRLIAKLIVGRAFALGGSSPMR